MVEQAGTIRVVRRYEQSADRVFDAWLDPEKARKFLFTTHDGQLVRAELDARVGGKFNFTDRRPGEGDIEHVGEYLEIDRPRRLVFTFAVPKYSPDYTTVTIDIVPAGTGCELTLTHEGVPAEWAPQTEQGWTQILGNLQV